MSLKILIFNSVAVYIGAIILFLNSSFSMQTRENEQDNYQALARNIVVVEDDVSLIVSSSEEANRVARAIQFYSEQEDSSPAQFSLIEILPSLGIVSGIPLSKFAIKKAGHSLFLKVYLTGSTIISVGLTRVWALDALFNEVWRDENHKHPHISVNTLSLLSTLPLTYAVWKNTSSIWYTLISFVSEWSLSSLGFYEIFREMSHRNQNAGPETDPSVRVPFGLENMELLIRRFYRYLMSQRDLDDVVEKLQESIESQNASGLPSSNNLEKIVFLELPLPSLKIGVKRLFYIFPVSSLVVNTVLAYQSTKEFTSTLIIVVPYIILTTVPSFVLQMYTTSSSVDDIWGDTINKRSYLKVKKRGVFYLVGFVSMLTASGSAIWGVEVVDEAFKGSFLSNTIPFFMFTTAVQIMIFESHCIRDYVGKKYFHYKEIKGSEKEIKTTKFLNIVSKVGEVSARILADNYAWYNPIGWLQKVFFYIRHRNHNVEA